MARKPNQPAEMIDPTTDAHDATLSGNANKLVVLQAASSAETSALAEQLGYEGDLSIGSLEDGIRFHQNQTIETCVAIGVRLVLLKQQCQHGEFGGRLELLGFSTTTAAKFMGAARKCAKFPAVGNLAKRIGSFKAFSEILLLDDDVIDVIARDVSELDDIDRMPASELRKAVRELKANGEATDKLLAAKDKKLNELSRKGQKVAFTDGCHVFSTIMEQIDQVRRQMLLSLGMLDEQMSAVLAVEIDDIDRPAAAHAYEQVARAFNDALQEPQAKLTKAIKRFEDTVALVADEALAA